MPYSISTNRTWRGLANTWSLRSIRSRSPAAPATAFAICGRQRREATADPAHQPERRGSRRRTCRGRTPTGRAAGPASSVRRLRFTWQRRVPGIQKNSAWSALDANASMSVEHVVEQLDGLVRVEVERRHALDGHRGDDARALRRPPAAACSRSGRSCSSHHTTLAVAVDQLDRRRWWWRCCPRPGRCRASRC